GATFRIAEYGLTSLGFLVTFSELLLDNRYKNDLAPLERTQSKRACRNRRRCDGRASAGGRHRAAWTASAFVHGCHPGRKHGAGGRLQGGECHGSGFAYAERSQV